MEHKSLLCASHLSGWSCSFTGNNVKQYHAGMLPITGHVCRYVALAQRREVRRQQLEQQYNTTPRAAPQLPGRAGAPAAPVPMPGVFPPNAVQFQPQFYGPPANVYGPGPQGPRGGPQVGYGGPMYPQVSPPPLLLHRDPLHCYECSSKVWDDAVAQAELLRVPCSRVLGTYYESHADGQWSLYP